MASASCWRCLSRPSTTLQNTLPRLSLTTTADFSSSSKALATPPKKATRSAPVKGMTASNQSSKGARTLAIKKKPRAKSGKPPAPGERKATRKRIVLSNTNAIAVKLRDFDRSMLGEIIKSNGEDAENNLQVHGLLGNDNGLTGKVVGLEGATVDSLRAVEAFRTTQGWGLFRRPAFLIREETSILCKKLVDAEQNKASLRLVIDGDKGTGKSLMLLTAMATAVVRCWIVINIPEAQDIVSASTDYSPIANTTPTLYSQNTYIANVLTQIAKANNKILQGLEITQPHDSLPIPIQSNISLARLCELGGRDPDIAWPIFQAFWSEITSEGRPPVLFALDNVSFIMGNSAYRSANFDPIHAHDLAIVKLFTELLSGASKLPNGGAVVAATSKSNAPVSKSLTLWLRQQDDRIAGRDVTKKDPFERKYDDRAEKVLENVETLKLKGLSRNEARGLMEYWAASGVLRSTVDERKVAESWALAGNGVVGEIERGALMMRI